MMDIIVSLIVALFSGRALFRILHKKEAGHSIVRYYSAGAFCISFIVTFSFWVFPALFGSLSGVPNSEEKIMRSLALFVGYAVIFTIVGFVFGKLKEKFGQNDGN